MMAESTPIEEIETSKKGKHVSYFKEKVLERHNGEEVNKTIKESIDNQSIVFFDKSTFYVDFSQFVALHVVEKVQKKQPRKP